MAASNQQAVVYRHDGATPAVFAKVRDVETARAIAYRLNGGMLPTPDKVSDPTGYYDVCGIQTAKAMGMLKRGR